VGKVKAKFSTRSILKKINKDNFEKKHVGKVKAKFSTSSILKKNSTKIILKNKHVGKHCSKTKTMLGNIVIIHGVLKKKTTKQNSQPVQYEKKINKDHFEKKKS
jgi:hypothetical protein